MIYRLKRTSPFAKPASPDSKLLLSEAVTREYAREWHRANPDFALNAMRSLGRCNGAVETSEALVWHTEALDIGLWSKKDVVQYPLACLHAGGSLISVPSVRQFFDQFSEADRDIMQRLIDTAPVHYWTYLRNKTSHREEKR